MFSITNIGTNFAVRLPSHHSKQGHPYVGRYRTLEEVALFFKILSFKKLNVIQETSIKGDYNF